MSLVRSAKALPCELATVSAWKERLINEPAYIVLADAYEYNLWSLDKNGCFSLTEHPLHEQTIENFLCASSDTYCEALIEVMARRGFDPYSRLVDKAKEAGVPQKAIDGLSYSLYHLERPAQAA